MIVICLLYRLMFCFTGVPIWSSRSLSFAAVPLCGAASHVKIKMKMEFVFCLGGTKQTIPVLLNILSMTSSR